MGVILISGSKVLYNETTNCSKPLNTDRTTIKANVPTPIPKTDIMEMMLTALCDFFALM
jgi:hypothetical protein